MANADKTKEQLIEELSELRGKIAILEEEVKKKAYFFEKPPIDFSLAFHASSLAMAIWTVNKGTCVDANDAFLNLFGYTRHEMVGKSCGDSNLSINARYQTDVQQAVTTSGPCSGVEMQIRAKDGAIFTGIVSADLLTVSGEPCWFTSFVDITERKRMEETLRESEVLFKSLVENAPEAIFVEAGGVFVYANPGMLNLLRASRPEQLLNQELLARIAPEYREAVRTLTALQKETGRPVPVMEQEYLQLDGSRVPTETIAVPVKFQGVDAHLVFVRDVAERKEAEEALRQSEEMYRTLIAASPDAIVLMDLYGHITFVSERAFELLGVDPEQDVIGRSVLEWVAPKDQGQALTAMQALFADGGAPFGEFTLIKEDGTTFDAEVHGTTIQSPHGTVQGVILIIRDVTDRKSLQAQLLQAQKMEAVGTLAGGVAHDFNNLLMAMMGYVSLIGIKVQEDLEVKNYLKQIQDCALRAANVTRGLLAFSRKQAVELKPQSTTAILTDSEKLLRRLVPEDVEFTVSLNEDVTIMADVTQIDQVLMNLVSNAKDAMPKGGRLNIETKAVHLGREFKQTHGFGEPGNYVVISVSDSGIGMDEDTQKKIFEPFFTTKEVGKGTGLGLAIVYGIIKQHNGYITVSSTPGRGTMFNIHLPSVTLEVSESEEAASDLRGGTETLLLAEDDQYVREIIGEILREYGYTVVEAEDGEDAVSKCRDMHDSIDLLILDVVMPGKNGKETYDDIQSINPLIPVIFMSGYTGDIVIAKGIQNTTVDYISKPVDPPELLNKIREVLERESTKFC